MVAHASDIGKAHEVQNVFALQRAHQVGGHASKLLGAEASCVEKGALSGWPCI